MIQDTHLTMCIQRNFLCLLKINQTCLFNFKIFPLWHSNLSNTYWEKTSIVFLFLANLADKRDYTIRINKQKFPYFTIVVAITAIFKGKCYFRTATKSLQTTIHSYFGWFFIQLFFFGKCMVTLLGISLVNIVNTASTLCFMSFLTDSIILFRSLNFKDLYPNRYKNNNIPREYHIYVTGANLTHICLFVTPTCGIDATDM